MKNKKISSDGDVALLGLWRGIACVAVAAAVGARAGRVVAGG